MAFGNPEVNAVIEHMTAMLDGVPMDGTKDGNRKYAYLLINWARREYPDWDPVGRVRRLINIAMSDRNHRMWATKMKYIWDNKGRLVILGRQQMGQQPKQEGGGYRIVYKTED